MTDRPLPLDTDYQAALEGVDASEWRLCAHDVPALRFVLLLQLPTSSLLYPPSKLFRLR